MGCGGSKRSAFDGAPLVSVHELLASPIAQGIAPSLPASPEEDGFVRVVGVVGGSAALLQSPFEEATAECLIKVVAKKQAGPANSGARRFQKAFEAFAAVPFALVDAATGAKVCVRPSTETKHTDMSLKFRSKTYNMEFDRDNTGALFGGGAVHTRGDMKSIPASGQWWTSFAGDIDPIATIQSRHSTYGAGYQRAVWVRSLRPKDVCAVKGKICPATEKEKEEHGEHIVVISLAGPESALSNVEKVISSLDGGASRMYSSGGGGVSSGGGNDENAPAPVIDMQAASIKWLKTNLPPLKDLPSLADQLELVDSRVDNMDLRALR